MEPVRALARADAIQNFHDVIIYVIIGVLGGTVIFTSYMFVVRGERVTDTNSQFREIALDIFNQDSAQFNKIKKLPWPIPIVYILIGETSGGVIFTLPCVFMGLAIGVVNSFYPLPEALILLAVATNYVPIGDWGHGRFLERIGVDLEFQFVDKMAGSGQGIKGLGLGFLCLFGFFFSLIYLFVGFGLVSQISEGAILSGVGERLYGLTEPPLQNIVRQLVILLFGIMVLTTPFVLGLYFLIYWFQQIRRLPSYLEFWGQHWGEQVYVIPSTPVWRPAGLTLPGVLLVVLYSTVLWTRRVGLWEDEIPPTAVLTGFLLAWFLIIATLVWSIHAGFQRRSQTLEGEGRDIVLAALFQGFSATFATIAVSSIRFAFVQLGVYLLLVHITYSPEMLIYSKKQTGARKFFGVLNLSIYIPFIYILYIKTPYISKIVFYIVVVLLVVALATNSIVRYAEHRH
jgi:hypothetical protein